VSIVIDKNQLNALRSGADIEVNFGDSETVLESAQLDFEGIDLLLKKEGAQVLVRNPISQEYETTDISLAEEKTKLFKARAFGWMIIIEAANDEEALHEAKLRASSASLLPSDVTSVEPADEEDIAWYQGMGGGSV
jgi:hypothetical protein